MNLVIKSIKIINFKGLKNQEVQFKDVTNIHGANGTGKTTVLDAFSWLLFGKDSTDSTVFNIKPLNPLGEKKDRTENEVTGTFLIDGEEVVIRRIHKEKWTKKRGEAESTFDGNEQLFFWNDVPLQAGEFKHKVESIIKESTFKAITNPSYFPSMHWKDQRTILEQIVGGISNDYIGTKKAEFGALLDSLGGKSLAEYRSEISEKKKRLKDQLATIPARIDEAEKLKPEPVNEEEISAKLVELQIEYDRLEKQIEDKNEAAKAENEFIQKTNQEIHRLKLLLQNKEAAHRSSYEIELRSSRSEADNIKSEIRQLESSIESKRESVSSRKRTANSTLENLRQSIADRSRQLDALKKEFQEVNARELDPASIVCKECGREHEQDKAEETAKRFLEQKRQDLQAINDRGQQLNKQIKDYQSEVDTIESSLNSFVEQMDSEILGLQSQVDLLNEKLESISANAVEVEPVNLRVERDQSIGDLIAEIKSLEAKMGDREGTDYGDLRIKKASVNSEMDSLKRLLQSNERIQEIDIRILKLKEDEKSFSQQLADLERKEFTIAQFERAKSDELESRVNGMFKLAKFKLFNRLVNGGEEPTCVVTYNGVPYPDLNNAAKIQVGLDIINTLSNHYGVSAPIFVDNRESVTEIPNINSQIINLFVSPEDKKLRVA